MRWKRVRPGLYVAGPYTVERHNHAGGFWFASGPGVPAVSHDTKDDAQTECEDAALMRIDGNEATVGPVVGDAVVTTEGQRRGHVRSVMLSERGKVLFCLGFARGRKLCLFRHEFSVVLP